MKYRVLGGVYSEDWINVGDVIDVDENFAEGCVAKGDMELVEEPKKEEPVGIVSPIAKEPIFKKAIKK